MAYSCRRCRLATSLSLRSAGLALSCPVVTLCSSRTSQKREREGEVVNLKEKWTTTPTGQRLASSGHCRIGDGMSIEWAMPIGHRSEQQCRHYMEERRRKLSVAAVLVLHYQKVDPRGSEFCSSYCLLLLNFCLDLPANFSQPGDHFLAQPCILHLRPE